MDENCALLITCSSHPTLTDKFTTHASICCRQNTLKPEFSDKADSIVVKYDVNPENFNVLHENCEY